MRIDLGLQHAQLGAFQVFLLLLVLRHQAAQTHGHGIQALGQGHELPGLHIRGAGGQLAVGDLSSELFQLLDLSLNEPRQVTVELNENVDHHAPQENFQQPAHHEHDPGLLVFFRLPGDAFGDVFLHQIPPQAAHVAQFTQQALAFVDADVVHDVGFDAGHILAHGFQGAPHHQQFRILRRVAAAGQLFLHRVDHGAGLAVRHGFPARDHLPHLVGDIVVDEGLQGDHRFDFDHEILVPFFKQKGERQIDHHKNQQSRRKKPAAAVHHGNDAVPFVQRDDPFHRQYPLGASWDRSSNSVNARSEE